MRRPRPRMRLALWKRVWIRGLMVVRERRLIVPFMVRWSVSHVCLWMWMGVTLLSFESSSLD